jgi:hypothetical protein
MTRWPTKKSRAPSTVAAAESQKTRWRPALRVKRSKVIPVTTAPTEKMVECRLATV